jgi:WD40 repeat protein
MVEMAKTARVGGQVAALLGACWALVAACHGRGSRPEPVSSRAATRQPSPTVSAIAEPCSTVARDPRIRGQLRAQVPSNSNPTNLAWSPDGSVLAMTTRDRDVVLVDPHTLQECRRLSYQDIVFKSVAFSPDGKTLAAGYDRAILLWRLSDRSDRSPRILQGPLGKSCSMIYAPDGQTLTSELEDKTLRIWRISDGATLQDYAARDGAPAAAAFSPDGRTVASGLDDNSVQLRPVAGDAPARSLKADIPPVFPIPSSPDGTTADFQTSRVVRNRVHPIAYSPDGRSLASESDEFSVLLWRLDGDASVHRLRGHAADVRSIAYSRDGKTLATASEDRTIRLWRTSDGARLRTLWGHQDRVDSVAFSPDGNSLASGSYDQTLRLWQVADGAALGVLESSEPKVVSVAFSRDGATIASVSDDNTIRLWHLGAGVPLRTLRGQGDQVISVAFSPDGSTLASQANDATVQLWRLRDGVVLRRFGTGDESSIPSVAFTPDGTSVVWGSEQAVWIGRLCDPAPPRVVKRPACGESVTLSPDGTTLACAKTSINGVIKLLRASDGVVLHTLRGEPGWVKSVAFSPDGKTLATGSDDKTILLWRVADGTALRTIQPHDGSVLAVAFSPDGTTLASAGNTAQPAFVGKTLRLWRVSDGALLYTLQAQSKGVTAVAFSPDGTKLVSGSDDGTLRLWSVADGKLLLTLRSLVDADAGIVSSPSGHFDFVGSEPRKAEARVLCSFESLSFPFEQCADRYRVPDLLAKVVAGDSSYSKP